MSTQRTLCWHWSRYLSYWSPALHPPIYIYIFIYIYIYFLYVCVYLKKKIKGLEKNQQPEDPQTLITSTRMLGWVWADLTGKRPEVTWRSDVRSVQSGRRVGGPVSISTEEGLTSSGPQWPPNRLLWIWLADILSWGMSQNHTSGQRRQQKVSCFPKGLEAAAALNKSLSLEPRLPSLWSSVFG